MVLNWINRFIGKTKTSTSVINDADLSSNTAVVVDIAANALGPVASENADTATTVWAIDFETTGLQSAYHRVVSMGGVELANYVPTGRYIHLVFDPMKKSDPEAEAVHGWDEWELRNQDRFEDHAAHIRNLLCSSTLLIGHNINFDLGFLHREIRKAGQEPIEVEHYCTLDAFRSKITLPNYKLATCAAHCGLTQNEHRHSAIEDAALAASLYAWLNTGQMPQFKYPEKPTNWRLPPPRPAGNMPRRAPRRKS